MTESSSQSRIEDIKKFYDILACIEDHIKGCRTLAEGKGRINWPKRGVYFFFDAGEQRCCSGVGDRVVRVGMSANLWKRLRQHRGNASSGGGNHRISVFRQLIGDALARRGDCQLPRSWNKKIEDAEREMKVHRSEIKNMELELEKRVSSYIGKMPFLWLCVPDEPSPNSMRAYIERNAIALLSNVQKSDVIDKASKSWLGNNSKSPLVQDSGLWNRDYVDNNYAPQFLCDMNELLQNWK